MFVKRFGRSLCLRVITAVIVGAFVGHFYPKFGVEMKPLGDGFIGTSSSESALPPMMPKMEKRAQAVLDRKLNVLDDELDAEPEATGAGLDPAGYLELA